MDANIVCFGDSWRVCMCFCSPEYYYDQEERTDEEAEPTFSEDEAVSQKGLRRSQSVKLSRSRVRKDVSVLFHWVRTLVCRYILLPQSVVLNLWTAWTLMSVFLKRCHQARYGSLKIKGKKRPALSSVNYGVWRHYCCHIHTHSWAGCWLVDGTVSLFLALTFHSAELFDDHLSADIFITRSGSKSAHSQRTRADFVVGRVICFFLR